MLSLSSVKKVLNNLFTSNMDGEEAVASPLPHALLHKDRFSAKLLPFISDVVANNGGKMSERQGSKFKKTLSKVWSIEEILFEVEAAVGKVDSIKNSQEIDHDASLMDEGLDSLGITELSDALQSRLGVELPSTFVFNNPTIADMSNHLHRLLSQEVVHQHPDTSKEGGDGHAFNMDMAIVGMSCCLPGA